MALVRGCRRCGGTALLQITRLPFGSDVVVVRLCEPCRADADRENEEAKARCTGAEIDGVL